MSIRKICGRNLKIYFRDKTAVFFSLLAVLIVIVLYILFLAQLQIDTVVENTNNLVDEDKISYLINSWILAGLLSITTVTSTLGGYGTIVEDIEKKKSMDFKSSPLSIMAYPLAGMISCIIIGTIISTIALGVYTVYIYFVTGYLFTFQQILQCVGFIIISTSMNAAFLGFIIAYIKTSSAFSSISLVMGTVIGFLNGLYVPIGSLPEIIQNVLKCLPFGHIASVFRKILMKDSIPECFGSFSEEIINNYQYDYGVKLQIGTNNISGEISILFVVAVMVVFMGLYFMKYGVKKKEI
ncbi:ABC transporter permease [bacterium 1XD42-8]|nr:ABC transporter permease [bacterium 1XD42-8]